MKIVRQVVIMLGVASYGTMVQSMELHMVDALGALKRQAEQGEARAQYELAECYLNAKNTERSLEFAKEWYEKAARQGHMPAWYRLGKLAERNKEYATAESCYMTAAELGQEPLSQHALSKINSSDSWGSEKSPEKERGWLEKLVSNPLIVQKYAGDEDYEKEIKKILAGACCRLALMHEKGMAGLTQSYATAADLYKKALTFNPKYEKALCRLAFLHMHGLCGARNISQARKFLSETSDTCVPALFLMGEIYRLENNWSRAVELYGKIQSLSPEAQFYLGMACEQGLGTKKDSENALALFMQSAEQGFMPAVDKLRPLVETHPSVCCIFGKISRDGKGLAKNEKTAIDYFLKSLRGKCAQGLEELTTMAETSPQAEFTMGMICENGDGVKADKVKAVGWYEVAAIHHHKEAQAALIKLADENIIEAVLVRARFFAGGIGGCERDVAQACEWYKKAVQGGSGFAAWVLGTYYLELKDIRQALDWFAQGAELGSQEAYEVIISMVGDNSHANYLLGQLHLNGRGVKKDRMLAERALTKAAHMGHAPACCAIASLLEEQPVNELHHSDDVLKCYQDILDFYKRAADQRFAGADENVRRIQSIIQELLALGLKYGKPNFNNILFSKLKEDLPNECSLEFLYWAAFILRRVETCNKDIQVAIYHTLPGIARFGRSGQLIKAVFKLFLRTIESEEFGKSLGKNGDPFVLLFRVCRGIALLQKERNPLELKESLQRDEDAIQDMRIEVFNCLFINDASPVDMVAYNDALLSIRNLWQSLRSTITNEMLWDEEYHLYGNRDTLRSLLMHNSNDRFRKRIIKIAQIVCSKLSAETQAALLSSWAVAGLHCLTRAEEETYKFMLLNATDAASLDRENLGLEMRVALCLAQVRKQCVEDMVPDGVPERIHQIAYIEKRIGQAFALVGDAEAFNDQFEMVVLGYFRNMKAQTMMAIVLDLYTVDAMVDALVDEINNSPRIPYLCIRRYFETRLGKSQEASAALGKLYDEDGRFTKQGARIVLYHLGYLK